MAQEHVATGISETVLHVAGAAVLDRHVDRGTVLVVCADGEWHVLPARLLAEDLLDAGFQATFAGGSVPPEHLVDTVRSLAPDPSPSAARCRCTSPARPAPSPPSTPTAGPCSRYLASAVLLADDGIYLEMLPWLTDLLAARGVPARSVELTIAVLAGIAEAEGLTATRRLLGRAAERS